MNIRRNLVSTAERCQYTPFVKFKSTDVNLLSSLVCLSDKMADSALWLVRSPANQTPSKGPIVKTSILFNPKMTINSMSDILQKSRSVHKHMHVNWQKWFVTGYNSHFQLICLKNVQPKLMRKQLYYKVATSGEIINIYILMWLVQKHEIFIKK